MTEGHTPHFKFVLLSKEGYLLNRITISPCAPAFGALPLPTRAHQQIWMIFFSLDRYATLNTRQPNLVSAFCFVQPLDPLCLDLGKRIERIMLDRLLSYKTH